MSAKPKVFLTRPLTSIAMERLNHEFDLTFNPEDKVLTKEEIIRGIKGVDGLLCLLTDKIDKDVFLANPDLQVVSNYAVGFNNIDIAYANEKKIPIGYTPDTLTETTADLTWALMLSVSRRILEGDAMVRNNQFNGWGPNMLLGGDVYGKTLGIIGLGRIGQAVAKRAQGFGMSILYTSRTDKNITYATRVSLDELLQQSDFVSLHAPYTQETHHLLDKHAFETMKSSAFLINTARGAMIDENALVHALDTQKIAGAALDVYENEPEVHPGLIQSSSTVVLPHIGSATEATRTNMAMMAIDNLKGILCPGEQPKAIANHEVLMK